MQTQILGLLTPLMALLFAVTFAAIWRAGRMKRYVLGFALGYLFFAIGFLVTHFLPANTFFVFHLTQVFYTIGSTLFIASTCERVGVRLHLPSIGVIYVISAIMLAFAIGFTNDAGPRLILLNMGYGAMYMVGVTTLISSRRRDWIDIAIIVVTAFQAVDFFIRPTLSVMFEQTIPTEAYKDSVYYSLIGLSLGIKSIAGAMVLIGASIADWTNNLRESSEKDPLTGLNNRAAFEQTMQTLIPRAQTEGRPLTLVVADIDHFKQVNDIWGHQSGDRAISSFGELIQQMVRGCDTAGRIGGEEFCIAVWNCENDPGARLADRIRKAFANLEHDGLSSDIRLTASFGVATARPGETYERLFARADESLYLAKSNGRDRVENAERRRADETAVDLGEKPAELTQAASA